MRLRSAVEVVEDDGKRWAFERFGAQVGDWKGDSMRGYLLTGAKQAVAFYVFAGGSIAAVSYFRADEKGNGFVRPLSLLS